MNNLNIPENSFDVIALEVKHTNDFERSLSSENFSKHYVEQVRDSFSDGKYDGELDLEPESYQWISTQYRNGYLAGVRARFDELFHE